MTEEERYQKLANERQAALDKSNQTYDDLLQQNTAYTNSLNDYLTNYQNTQNDIYDKQTQFNVDLQNQNKQKAEQEYQKEAQASKNAYYDFINPYGVQREIQAQNGLANSGYSETVKSQAWTTQQNRTAQARATMNQAKLQFDNAIKEAYLQNDTLKAELALKMLEQKQNEMLRSFNYVSDTQQQRLSNNQNLDSDYNNRYNTLYGQIADEKATAEAIRQYEKNFLEQQRQYNETLAQNQRQWEAEQAEKQRQYNETMAYQKEQDRIAQEQWEREYALSQAAASSRGSGGSSGGSRGSSGSNNTGTQINVVKNPYTGTRNPDADRTINGGPGTFSNGYQPNNVGGNKLSSSGYKVSDIFGNGAYGSTGVNLGGQTIWKAGNKYYVWDGSIDDYIDVTSKVSYALTHAGPSKW